MSTPSRPQFVLATPTKEFSLQTFRQLFYSARSIQELAPAKKYLVSYFARGDVGVYRWQPKNQIFKHYNKKDACDSFIQSDILELKNNKGEVISKFAIQSWFFRDTPFFSLEVNPSQPRIYRELDGGFYINLFHGFLHANPPPFHEFSKEIRNQVKLVLNHMSEVLSSFDEKQAYYMKSMVMRIAIGQKLQKTMFLFSGPGTGKTMLTWFLREMVLGPKITAKTANEKIITGQFNKELEGKSLLVLEEMSNSKSADWITFANRLKDFIDSDTIMIEEKHKTPYPVANITNLIISSNNSKTIRLDRDDRRYFIPDISEKYVENGIGMDHYYAPLDKAIKNPEVGKAFYSYALEYVRLNPNFDERKIPMSKTKLMMVNRDNNKVHEFIKEKYVCQYRDLESASSYLYTEFKAWLQDNYSSIKRPPTVQEFTRTLEGLGLKAKRKRIGDRKADKKMQWYSSSYKDLYTVFQKKNMIDDAENINEPEDYQSTKNTVTMPTEVLPAEESSDNPISTESISVEPSSKKTPPPVPPKPDHLKINTKPLNTEDESQQPVPSASKDENHVVEFLDSILSSESANEPEPYGIPGPSGTSDKPISKDEQEKAKCQPSSKQSDPLAENIMKKDKKGKWIIDDDKLNTIFNEKPEYPKSEPEVKVYTNKPIENLYESAKKMWTTDGGDPEEFDWETFAIEIEDLSNYKTKDPKDYYHYSLSRAVQTYRNRVNSKDRFSYDKPTYIEIAEMIRKYYKEDRGQMQVTPPEDYKTISIKKIQGCPKVDKKEYARAMGYEEASEDDAEDKADDADEDWYEALKKA